MSAYKEAELEHRMSIVRRLSDLYTGHFGSLRQAALAFHSEPSRYVVRCPKFPNNGPVALVDSLTGQEISE